MKLFLALAFALITSPLFSAGNSVGLASSLNALESRLNKPGSLAAGNEGASSAGNAPLDVNVTMGFNVCVFLWRKSGTSAIAFREHYENLHVPLIKEVAGSHFPLSHTRHYLAHSEDDTPTVLVGTPADFSYDVFVELVFEDSQAFHQFIAVLGSGDAAAKVADDEEKFLDRAKTRAVVVGDVERTTA